MRGGGRLGSKKLGELGDFLLSVIWELVSGIWLLLSGNIKQKIINIKQKTSNNNHSNVVSAFQ